MAHISKQEMRTIIKITTIGVAQNSKIYKTNKTLGQDVLGEVYFDSLKALVTILVA